MSAAFRCERHCYVHADAANRTTTLHVGARKSLHGERGSDFIHSPIEDVYVRAAAAIRCGSLQPVGWTPDAERGTIQDVGIDHGRADVRVGTLLLLTNDIEPTRPARGQRP